MVCGYFADAFASTIVSPTASVSSAESGGGETPPRQPAGRQHSVSFTSPDNRRRSAHPESDRAGRS